MFGHAVLLGAVLFAAPTPGPSADPHERIGVGRQGRPRGPPPPRPERLPELPDGATSLDELGLLRQDDGSYIYRDPARRFSARFNIDGTVDFADRWRRPSSADSQNGACCSLRMLELNPFVGIPLSGPLEWLIQMQGKDLAASAKMDLLERTSELRTRMAVAWHLRILEERLAALEPELLQLWSDSRMSVSERKQLLFQRWDECDERFGLEPGDVPPDAILDIDRARLQTAEVARRRIEAFVRRHARRGTASAYTAAELERLNRKRVSREPFAPYRAGGETTVRATQ